MPPSPLRRSGPAPALDDDGKPPLGMIGAGVLFVVIGLGLFYWLNSLETNGGSARMPAWIVAIYDIAGKWGVLAVVGGLGLSGIIGGVVKLVQTSGRR